MLRGLLAQTTMSRTELYRLFNRFKALCQVRCRAAALPIVLPRCRAVNPPPPRSSLPALLPPYRPLACPLLLHPAPCRALPSVAWQLSGTPGSIDKKTFKEGVSSLAFEDDAFVRTRHAHVTHTPCACNTARACRGSPWVGRCGMVS